MTSNDPRAACTGRTREGSPVYCTGRLTASPPDNGSGPFSGRRFNTFIFLAPDLDHRSWFHEVPDVIGEASGHRGGLAGEGLVRASEVVVQEVERYGVARFSAFFEKALVKRVKRRMPIRIVRFCRST